MIKLHFLGTNGWYSSPTGDTTCLLLQTKDYDIICDAGNGIHKLDQYRPNEAKPAYLFLSHFHIDHISGLHMLAKFCFKDGLTIVCHKGGKAILDRIICQPYTIALKDLPYKVKVLELDEGVHNGFPFGLSCRNLRHSTMCFGYRFTIGKKVISFCTDTGRCPSVLELSKGADIFITECAMRSGETSEEWPHLNPEDAASMAKEAKVKKLVLMHFDAQRYQSLKDRRKAEQQAKKIFSNTIAVKDGLTLNI